MWQLKIDRIPEIQDFISEMAALDEAEVAMMLRIPVYELRRDGDLVYDMDDLFEKVQQRRVARGQPPIG